MATTTKSKKGANKPGYDFIVKQLERNPSQSYGEIKARADKKELKIFPIMYGRAKRALGMVGTKPKPSPGPSPKPRKAPKQSSNGRASIETDLIRAVQAQDDEMRRLRTTLVKIRELLNGMEL